MFVDIGIVIYLFIHVCGSFITFPEFSHIEITVLPVKQGEWN